MLLFSYVLPAVLAHTSSIPFGAIHIGHETYGGYSTARDEELTVRARAIQSSF
jgi:hypothetical protein